MAASERSLNAEETRPLAFLSHAGQDADTAKALAGALRDSGVEVWLDVERLRPGDRWMQKLEAALQEAKAFLLYVGPTGVRNWVDNELRVALDRSAKESDFRLIPMLGPGSDPESLPPFLKLYQWIDFRAGFEPVADLKRLIEAVSRKPTEAVSVLPPDRDPFRGLFVFDVEDALLFYGRERETAELVERLSVANFLAVVGDSGTGKSSLVRAGLVPALHRGRFSHRNSWIGSWRVAILRPGGEPFREMAEALPQLDPDMDASSRLPFISSAREELSRGPDALQNAIAALVPAGAHTLLIVDQFEELFTLTSKLEERGRFIDTLLAATNASGTRAVYVVITLRADFYSQCWQHEQLVERINENQYLVRRVGPSQLRQVIEKPLSLAGATAEAGLVDALLHDVGDEPGNLPLLEHALLQLWRRRKGRTLTHQGYEDIGRLEGALRNHANEVFESLHSDEERRLVRKIFVSLTQLGEGAEDTRRRSMKADLLALGAERVSAANVLKRLVDARLLTASGEVGMEDGGADVVEVAHEALIREWPLLRSWINDNRESLRIERRIRRAADEWNEIDRDPSALLRGTRLAEAQEWAQENSQELPQKAREFLDASVAVREEELTRERERQQAELETERRLKEEAERRAQAEQSVAKQARRNLRVTQITGAVVVVAFVTAAWAFVDASRQRDRVQRYALSDKESLVLDLLQVKPVEALARAVQAVGESLENFGQVPLSVEAALSTAVEVAREKNVIAETIVSAALHPNNEQIIAATADNRIRVFTLDGTPLGEGEEENVNRAGPRDVVAAGPGESAGDRNIRAVVACPAQGHECSTVIALNGNSVEKWEGGELRPLFTEDGGEIRGIALSNEHTVALLTNDARNVVLRELDSNVTPRHFSFDFAVDAFALSPNGELLAVSGREATPVIVVVDTSTSRRIHKLIGHQAPIHALAFSPDGRTLASGNGVVAVEDTRHEAAVKVWDLRTGDAVASSYLRSPLGFSPSDGITSIAFSSDGRTLAAGTYEGAVHIWNEDGRRMGEPFPAKRGTVQTVAFTRSSETLFTASQGGVQLWDVGVRPTGVRLEHVGEVEGRDTRLQVNWVDVSPQGDSLLTGVVRSGSPRGALQKWSLEGKPLGEPFGPSEVYIFVISKDGKIATGNSSGVQLWSEDGQLLVQSFDGLALTKSSDSGDVVPDTESIWALGFAPDSSYLVGGGDSGVLFQWDLDGDLIRELEGRHAGKVWSLAVREDAIVSVSAFGGDQPGTVLLHRSDGSLMDHVDFRGSRLEGPFTGESVQVIGVDFFPSTSDGFVTGDSSGVARIWSPSGRVLREFQAQVGGVSVVRVSRDGRYIASGGSDQVVRVWDAHGMLLRQIPAHRDRIVGLSFDPAGNLVSGSLDGEARIWSSSLWKPNWRARLEVACSRLKQHPFLNNRSSRIAVGACQTCDQYVWTTDRSGPARASVCGDASGRVRSFEANLWSPKESSTPPPTR